MVMDQLLHQPQLSFICWSAGCKLDTHKVEPVRSVQVCGADIQKQAKIPENEIIINHAVIETSESKRGGTALDDCSGNMVGRLQMMSVEVA